MLVQSPLTTISMGEEDSSNASIGCWRDNGLSFPRVSGALRTFRMFLTAPALSLVRVVPPGIGACLVSDRYLVPRFPFGVSR